MCYGIVDSEVFARGAPNTREDAEHAPIARSTPSTYYDVSGELSSTDMMVFATLVARFIVVHELKLLLLYT